MTEEEKKVIKSIEDNIENTIFPSYFANQSNFIMHIELDKIKTLLRVIQKQDTEINKLNNVIDRIIEYTVDTTYRDLEECEFEDRNNVKCIKDCKQCIKKYFMKEDK